MSKPLADRGQVHARFQQRDSSAVSHAVRVQPLVAQCGNVGSSVIYVFGENVPYAEASQGNAAVVEKHPRVRADFNLTFFTMGQQHGSSLRPQWTESLFAALPEKPNLIRPDELKIARFHVNYFLNTGSGVEHGSQQSVISPTVRCRTIYSLEYSLDLVAIEIFNHALISPFEGNGKKTLRSLDLIGVMSSNITEERVNSCEADIPRCYAVFAFLLEMSEERNDSICQNILQVQIANLFLAGGSNEPKQ
jgi:hypothetical protein